MLSPADRDLVGRDPGVRGLGRILDPDAFLELLAAAAPGLLATRARAIYLRYKPATRCLVLYELHTPAGRIYVHANAHAASRRLNEPSSRGGGVAGLVCPGALIFEKHAIVASVFPHDHGLRTLAHLWEPAARERQLRKMLPDRPELWCGQLDTLAYKPERRHVALLTARSGKRAVLKTYTAAGYERARMGGRAFRSSPLARIADRLGGSRRHRIVVLDWLPGETLQDLLSRGECDLRSLRTVGAALAELHCQQRAKGRVGPAGADAASLVAAARTIAFVCPSLAKRASRLARELELRLRQSPSSPVSIHGDFHAGQVLLHEATNILDLDRAGLGDPTIDLGSFVAHLERAALEGQMTLPTAEALADVLVEGYEEASARSIRRTMDLAVAAALLQLMPHPFRTRDQAWPERITLLMERAESRLDRTATARVTRSSASASTAVRSEARADSKLLVAPDALDCAAMQRYLSRLYMHPDSTRVIAVNAIRMVRHKPGRRCLIEYDLVVQRPGEAAESSTCVAKVRSKGADTRTYELVRALWRRGFTAGSPDGVSVPEALGVLPELKMWLQRKVPGTPATRLLSPAHGTMLGRRTAEAIHKLHGCGVRPSRRHGTDTELQILRERLSLVSALATDWASRLARVYGACADLATSLPTIAEPYGIHRDFYPDQLIVDGNRLYLLDLDLYASGDPALDVGNFCAHVTEYSLRRFGDPEGLADCEAALTERFQELNARVAALSIEIYKTLTLARLVHVSTVLPERRAFTERLLAICEVRLGLGPRHSREGNAGRPRRQQHSTSQDLQVDSI